MSRIIYWIVLGVFMLPVASLWAQPTLPPPIVREAVHAHHGDAAPNRLKPLPLQTGTCPICMIKPHHPAQPCMMKAPAAHAAHHHKGHHHPAPKPKAPKRTVPQIIQAGNQEARQQPNPHGYLNSMQVYNYMPGALFQVYAATNKVTSIMLHTGEELQTFAAGDTVRWEVASTISSHGGQEHDLILVKPKRPELQTNLVITTNQRTYFIELHSSTDTYMASVSWNYPHQRVVSARRQARQAAQRTQDIIAPTVNLQNAYFEYDIENIRGEPRWQPIRVFDDGRKTYIQFPQNLATTEAPALFILTSRKKTQLVNYRVKGTYYIVDRLFDRAELRVGQKRPATVRITRQAPHRVQTAAHHQHH